jgi:hypothetical protein
MKTNESNSINYLLDRDMREALKTPHTIEEYKPNKLSPTYFAKVNKYTAFGTELVTLLDKWEMTKDNSYLTKIRSLLNKGE